MGTMTADEAKAKGLALIEEARGIAKRAEDDNRDFTDTERAEVKAKLEEAKSMKTAADAADGDAAIRSAVDNLGDLFGKADPVSPFAMPAPVGNLAGGNGRKSLGDLFVSDENVAAWLKRLPSIPEKGRIESPAMGFRGLKDLVTGSSDTSAGALFTTDWRGLIDEGLYRRPLSVRSLVTNGTTGSDTVEYARETTMTSNAAPVAEASGTSAGDASGDVAGTKPESSIAYEKVTAVVKTIAHWIPATKRALSDAAQVRTLIDNFLRFGLEEALEDEMLNGDDTGEHFEGILEVDGTQPQAWDTNLLVTTRKAKTKVRTVGRAVASAYLLNPEDNEKIDLLRTEEGGANTGSFMFGGPAGTGVSTLWGLPRIECEALDAGVGVVGDWSKAVLWDREAASIAVSDSHADFFVRNLIAILAELRAAFGVVRPSAFVIIDLTA